MNPSCHRCNAAMNFSVKATLPGQAVYQSSLVLINNGTMFAYECALQADPTFRIFIDRRHSCFVGLFNFNFRIYFKNSGGIMN